MGDLRDDKMDRGSPIRADPIPVEAFRFSRHRLRRLADIHFSRGGAVLHGQA